VAVLVFSVLEPPPLLEQAVMAVLAVVVLVLAQLLAQAAMGASFSITEVLWQSTFIKIHHFLKHRLV